MKKSRLAIYFTAMSLLAITMLTGCSSQSAKEAISECGKEANEVYPGPQKGENYLQKLNEVKSCMLDKGFEIDQGGYDRYMEMNSKYIENDSDQKKYSHIAYTIDYVWR